MRITLALCAMLSAAPTGATPGQTNQSRATARPPQWGELVPGTHAAGFRLIEAWDRGRTMNPATDYTAHRRSDEAGIAMPLGVWYPAVKPVGRAPLDFLALSVAVRNRERYERATSADTAQIRQDAVQTVRMAGGDTTAADARPAAILARATASYRDATPVRGSFPVAVIASGGAIGAVTVLAEYLATHGWIVVAVPSQNGPAGGLQVTEPLKAIEIGVNAIAFAANAAHALPGADLRRLALIGVNFDSFSVLDYQLRNMNASALVTINGWETIDERASTLRNSIWFDAARIRIPLLNVHWDQPGGAPANRSFLEELKYSERRSITINGLDHFGLIGNPLAYAFSRPAQRSGYQYLIRAVHATIAKAVGLASDSVTLVAPSTTDVALIKENWYRPALPPVPTRAEFFEILGDRRDLATAMRLFREARGRDSTVQMFSESDMNLVAFRFQRGGKPEDVLAIHRMTVDGYPKSHTARNTLGNYLLTRADTAGAIVEFEKAISLVESNSTLSATEKTEQARVWREKVARLRR